VVKLGMLKYLSKFVLDIFPSVFATVVGAYIVNYYIIPKTGADVPKPAVHSTAAPAAADQGAAGVKAIDAKSETTKPETAQDPAGKPGVKAAADKASDSKDVEKPVETAKAAPEAKRPIPREKAAAKAVQPNAQPTDAATATTTEERRDANELARAVIERLRTPAETTSRPAETPARVQDAVRTNEPARSNPEPVRIEAIAEPPASPRQLVQPLPPAVNVMVPGGEGAVGGRSGPASVRKVDADRLIPPADIPAASRQLEYEDAAAPAPKPSVADDVLSAARSVIHAVVPQ
jgi:hypothetical protein